MLGVAPKQTEPRLAWSFSLHCDKYGCAQGTDPALLPTPCALSLLPFSSFAARGPTPGSATQSSIASQIPPGSPRLHPLRKVAYWWVRPAQGQQSPSSGCCHYSRDTHTNASTGNRAADANFSSHLTLRALTLEYYPPHQLTCLASLPVVELLSRQVEVLVDRVGLAALPVLQLDTEQKWPP